MILEGLMWALASPAITSAQVDIASILSQGGRKEGRVLYDASGNSVNPSVAGKALVSQPTTTGWETKEPMAIIRSQHVVLAGLNRAEAVDLRDPAGSPSRELV